MMDRDVEQVNESEPLNVDAILDALDPEFHDPGVDLYGGANLEPGRPVMSEAICSHVWDREALPVMLVRPGGYQLGQTYEAFPCQLCGALLVMNERDG